MRGCYGRVIRRRGTIDRGRVTLGPRADARRALEEKMLDKVGDPVLVVRFMAGSILDPDSEADGTVIQHLLGHDTDTVIQNGLSEHAMKGSQ